MNTKYRDWLDALIEWVERYREKKFFCIRAEAIELPLSVTALERYYKPGDIPEDLRLFYTTACAACDVECHIAIPDEHRVRHTGKFGAWLGTAEYFADFQLVHPAKALEFRSHILGIFDYVYETQSTMGDAGNRRELLASAIPLARLRAADSFVIYGKPTRSYPDFSGVYYLPLELMNTPERAIRYGNDLDDWLAYLARNCYIAPHEDFRNVQWTAGGRAANGNPQALRTLGELGVMPARSVIH